MDESDGAGNCWHIICQQLVVDLAGDRVGCGLLLFWLNYWEHELLRTEFWNGLWCCWQWVEMVFLGDEL